MKERGVIFDAKSVNSILAGAKTQTRRVMKNQPGGNVAPYATTVGTFNWVIPATGVGTRAPFACPYGAAGDRLWVREVLVEREGGWVYAADGNWVVLSSDDPRYPAMLSWAHHNEREVCIAMYMPKWASRITLELTSIRIERVQDITDEDAKAEGIAHRIDTGGDLAGAFEGCGPIGYRNHFRDRWQDINGKRKGCSWDENAWVWALSFRRVETT